MVVHHSAPFAGKKLDGVSKQSLIRYHDSRGWFSQQWTEPELMVMGFREGFIQLNMAMSKQGVLRGMHRQDQTKLVQVVEGRIFDVALNPETGEWGGWVLGEGEALLIPPQYAHGYFVMSDHAIVQYVVDRPWDKTKEEIFGYADYGIEWPTKINLLLSEKDGAA